MKHYVRGRIKTNSRTNLLLKLNRINVDIRNIKYEKDYIYFDILSSDIKKIKKYLISYKFEVIDELGIYKLKKELRVNMLFIVSVVFACVVFLILSNIIVKVNIIHQNKDLRELINEDLKEYGVTPMSFKKSYDAYEEIISKIKNKHKDRIEWLEIDVDGMVVNIRVEERILNEEKEEKGYCHVVANTSGIITHILTAKGVALVGVNDFVKKGDILISGEVKLNEEVKNDVCASGRVYAEVWYNVKTSLPLNYTLKEKTGKMRYNIMVKNDMGEYVILKSRVKDKEVKNKYLVKLFGYQVYLQKEYEVIQSNKRYTEEEALNKAISLVHEKLAVKETQTPKIIKEKVLQKSVNNDTLDIEMFVAVEEQIGVVEPYTKEMDCDTSDRTDNDNNNSVS